MNWYKAYKDEVCRHAKIMQPMPIAEMNKFVEFIFNKCEEKLDSLLNGKAFNSKNDIIDTLRNSKDPSMLGNILDIGTFLLESKYLDKQVKIRIVVDLQVKNVDAECIWKGENLAIVILNVNIFALYFLNRHKDIGNPYSVAQKWRHDMLKSIDHELTHALDKKIRNRNLRREWKSVKEYRDVTMKTDMDDSQSYYGLATEQDAFDSSIIRNVVRLLSDPVVSKQIEESMLSVLRGGSLQGAFADQAYMKFLESNPERKRRFLQRIYSAYSEWKENVKDELV